MIPTIKEPDQLFDYIDSKLQPKEKERKEKGEVFTPLSVVEEILHKLPKKIWKDHSLKWLDPATGIGNFPIMIYFRLMDGLKKWQPNEEKRRKHILENMLTMIEINQKSIRTLKKIFCNNEYKLNIYKKSFLKLPSDKLYHIVIGNPPYNEGGTGRTTGSRMPLWPKFIDKALEIMTEKEQSYLAFIHPTGWRKPYSPVTMQVNIGRIFHTFMEKGSLLYLKMTDEIIPNFPPVDIYIYTNRKNKKTTVDSEFKQVVSSNQKIMMNDFIKDDFGFIPSFINRDTVSIFNKLFKKRNSNDFYNVQYDAYLVVSNQLLKNRKKGYPHAFYYREGKYLEVYKYDEKNQKKEYFQKPKIIMTFNGSTPIGSLNAVYYQKPIGTSAYTMFYIVEGMSKNEIMKHVNFFNSSLIHFLMVLTQFSPAPRNKNDHKILNRIQIPNLPTNPTDNDIYKYYKITKKEQGLINTIIGDSKTKKTKKKKRY